MKKEYFSFEGRLSRKKYFKRIFLLTFIYMIVAVIFTLMMIGGGLLGDSAVLLVLGIVLLIVSSLAATVSAVSLMVRRCHDLNRSGWYVLMTVLVYPYLQFLFKDGTKGENRFGADPLQQVDKV